MKSHRLILPALLLALLLPHSVLAWDDTGHELVAGIAWDNMEPPAQKKAIELLSAAPANACLRNLLANDSRPLAVRQREFFMRAATWPDLVRSGPCSSFNQPGWHFKDRFWQGVSGATNNTAPQDRPDLHATATNAVERLGVFRHSVACDTSAPCVAKSMRAMQLAWMLHLTGDIHQPLHTASRVTPQLPGGDEGGNGFLLGSPDAKLHGYWDHIVGTRFPPSPGESTAAYLKRVLDRIVLDHPLAAMAGRIHPAEFDVWASEGFQTTKRAIYPSTLQHATPSNAYRDLAFGIADEAIALGGYRLANLLNQMFVPAHAALPAVIHSAAHAAPAASHAPLPRPDHIVIVIEENKDYTDVIGSATAKYINALAARGALLRSFYAAFHPSQPNYVAFFAGDTLGVCKDECPIGPFNKPNLGAALIAAGKSFAGYAENLPASDARKACAKSPFAPKHCPWVDFTNVPASASRDFTSFPKNAAGFAALPAVSFVIPNLLNDMHNGNDIAAEVNAGDDWLEKKMGAYADWAEKHNSLLIVTWDEDSSSYKTNCAKGVIATTPPGNHIPTIIVGQAVAPGTTSQSQYTHQDLLRTILDMYGLAAFGGAATAKAIEDIWR